MKKGMMLLVVSVGALVAAPFGFSFWAESRLNGLLGDLNDAGVVNFTVIKMDRGWFSSDSLIEAEVAASLTQKLKKYSDTDGSTPTLILKSTIHHGPFPFSGGRFSLIPVVGTVDTKFVKSIGSDEPLINMDYSMLTHLELAGKSHIKVDIPEWSGPIEGGKANLEWKGLQADLKLSKGLGAADISMDAPYLKISGEQGGMLLESLVLHSASTVGIEGLSLGSAKFSIANITVEDKKKGVDINIGDIGIIAETKATGDSIDSVTRFDMAKFALSGEEFGPGVFSLAFRNLDAGAIARISNKYKEVSQHGEIPQEQMSMMLGATLLSEMSNLLEKGPEIEITELSLGSVAGKLVGDAKITVDSSRPELLTNPMLIKDAIIGEVDLEVPEELLVALNMASLRQEFKSVDIQYTEEQLKKMAKSRVTKTFSPLVAGNIFTQVGNMYKFSASFKNGIPVVNGSPFQIPMGGGMPPGQ